MSKIGLIFFQLLFSCGALSLAFVLASKTPYLGASTPGLQNQGLALEALFEPKRAHHDAAWAKIDAANQTTDQQQQSRLIAEVAQHIDLSLKSGPGNAQAWAAKAWHAHAVQNRERVFLGLEQSWALAPSARRVAIQRVVLASLYWKELPVSLRRLALNDLAAARLVMGENFDDFLNTSQTLTTMWTLQKALRSE